MSLIMCTHDDELNSLSHGLILCTQDEAEYLMHHGIKGQKHGIRRWQNEDGSLTPEGYIHYGVGQGNRDKAKADKFQAKANKIQLKADKYQVKADKYAKKAEKNEERGKAEIERDKALEADAKAKEEKAAHDKAVVQKIDDLTDKMSQYDSMSADEKKSFGDDLLRGLKEYNNWVKEERMNRGYRGEDNYKIEGYNNSTKLENDLIQQVFNKSGSWNGEDWVKGSHAEKAYPAVDKAYKELWARQNEIEKQIGYKTFVTKPRPSGLIDTISNSIKTKQIEAERARLQRALKADKIYQALNDAANRAERDLNGAILRDLGFSDTPENRSLIWPYTYID